MSIYYVVRTLRYCEGRIVLARDRYTGSREIVLEAWRKVSVRQTACIITRENMSSGMNCRERIN